MAAALSKIINVWSKIIDRLEPEVSLELEQIEFNERLGQYICVMHLVGKNIFPKMTTDEILSNPKARAGLSHEDLIEITKLDTQAKMEREKLKIAEYDTSGIVTIIDKFGERKRYSERELSGSECHLQQMSGKDAHRVGYQVGFKDGFSAMKQKLNMLGRIKSIFNLK